MLVISDKYTLLLPPTILALVEEITKISKVSKVLISKIVKPKKNR
jgi:hypothetical protein